VLQVAVIYMSRLAWSLFSRVHLAYMKHRTIASLLLAILNEVF